MDDWYLENLVCPVDKTPLHFDPSHQMLVSEKGRRFPVVDGIPVMLVEEVEQTHDAASSSLEDAHNRREDDTDDPFYLATLGISAAQRADLASPAKSPTSAVDPVVAYLVGATNGNAYRDLVGKLQEYPIPDIRLPTACGAPLLDVGCNWGRWSVSAAKKGYAVTGIDPQLGAVMAARRVARQLNLEIRYVVGDARFLPFRDATFENVFSYSVLQHLDKSNAEKALGEVARVLETHGQSLIQMPNWLGTRSLYHQARRGFRAAKNFEVRYWTLSELRRTFERTIGRSSVSVDCYFGLGLQPSDRHLMSPLPRLATDVSDKLRLASEQVHLLKHLADSVYIHSQKAQTD